ncbi:Thermostable carboxypeptidase 1 [Tritonibacter multivorans]|uniref:Metal-dependent carboxypeptidase n=1 Tax=Tritonibacter multivorans TaxID=928856 RepID=A0A0P1GK43_9RHOB|nr:carboxypeptidase M32 [Tritonibacter multivorans]MDA7421512.1 carboxypeptidase M32 [Tritonibacter multivorans]CUH82268.1 Thermostable carboxypeptidase 1 [Tritonibacter multivorans]SFC97333.1 carboxypeptidase Taq [Tritonibacter multivorans]
MNAFEQLLAFSRDTQALGQIAGRLGWDQETMMPAGAGAQRGEEMAAIEGVLHARRSDPKIAEWLASAEAPDAAGAAILREIRYGYDRTRKVPADLARRIAQVTSESQAKWAQARADEDVAAFLPVLEEVVALKREEGQALAEGGDVYDAMVADYERGVTGSDLAKIFDAMRPGLVDLRARVLEKPAPKALEGRFDEGKQLALSEQLAVAFGYNLNNGRIDKAVHPFCSGSGQDVRVTTRTSATDPFNCFYSTVHEVGHAAYEQNVDQAYLLTPLGGGVSMGVHESQSRIYENQLGRSRAFTGWLFAQMQTSFGDFGIENADEFYAAVNAVHRGYIRTESDELQYNLHVMLRFGLERALMTGDLSVGDLEAAWNDRFAADFGYAVDKPSNGVLQDVHWSVGLFGYFPTYSLGNIYAGCLYEALTQAVPNLEADLAEGNTRRATEWLRENLQQHGGLRSPKDTIVHAIGGEPTHEPLKGYLEKKFSEIYDL